MTTKVSGGGGGSNAPSFKGLICEFFSMVIPSGSPRTNINVAFIDTITPDVTAVVGQSIVTINTPGWYLAIVLLLSESTPENATPYHLIEGGSMDFTKGLPPEAFDIPSSARPISMNSTGAVLFTDTSKTYQMSMSNPGALDQTVGGQMILEYLGPDVAV